MTTLKSRTWVPGQSETYIQEVAGATASADAAAVEQMLFVGG